MSKRAEEAARKAYFDGPYYGGRSAQRLFIEGYLQAEKDLALTWEDIRELDEWISAVQTSDNLSGEELYKEVLKRFNEYKEERK